MDLAWATDIHLDHCSGKALDAFIGEIQEAAPDALVLGGDISSGAHLYRHLWSFELLEIPVYFVLGNHDAYTTSIEESCAIASEVSRESEWLHYLPDVGVVPLTEGACLIGHGCWADARAGSWTKSNVMINDYVLIQELAPLRYHRHLLRQRLEELGDEAADWFSKTLPKTEGYQEIVVVTHVPPWRRWSTRYAVCPPGCTTITSASEGRALNIE